MIRIVPWSSLALAALVAAGPVIAQDAAPVAAPAPAAAPVTKPTVYALVSAVGGTLTFVRQREQVGSNRVDTFQRMTLTMPDASVDGAVLRGLKRTILASEPTAEFVFMRLNPKELENVSAQRRGEAALGKLASAFDAMPERMNWDRIIVITPKYLFPGRRGMASKLNGVGVYIQPLYSSGAPGPESLQAGGYSLDEDAETPEGENTKSSRFVAPYFYTQLWILDAKTLTVLDTQDRYEYRKIFDPTVAAIDVGKMLFPDQLSQAVERFVETASARALREAIGVVTVSEPKPVDPHSLPKPKTP
jgi:hypothetical protein